MGKISPVSAKYIVHSSINIEGVVDRPDVIGAIFGQTEGLLGADLELRELQRSGRIGRIEVSLETKSGKTKGDILIPSSLDKAETAIVGAALEIIQRIGPCNAKIQVEKIEDVRVSKRAYVVDRAKSLLKNLMDSVMPDSQEIADEVAYSVRVMEIQNYGRDRLPAGPSIDESDEIIVVEGRADVLNLLKHGLKNAIAMNGSSVPQTLVNLSKQKIVTVFVDGDRGGDLNIKELLQVSDIDYVTKAPDGKEVEEITKKEIHKALRGRVAAEQAKLEIGNTEERVERRKHTSPNHSYQRHNSRQSQQSQRSSSSSRPVVLSAEKKEKFKSMLEDLVGTKGAYLLDEKMNILGKVPYSELATTIKSLKTGIYAVIFDGQINKDLLQTAEYTRVKHLIGMDSNVRSSRLNIMTINDF